MNIRENIEDVLTDYFDCSQQKITSITDDIVQRSDLHALYFLCWVNKNYYYNLGWYYKKQSDDTKAQSEAKLLIIYKTETHEH